ncbi:MAG: hypothetical protein DRN49_00575 [Thaumarchaeota archaeon]|nr:MAG: hypothetical protein DRN49_00575 [Nitrososphaerota archaeon]
MVVHENTTVKILIEYVALIADLMGRRREIIELPRGSSVKDLINELVTRSNGLKNILQEIGIIVIVNGLSSKLDKVLNDNDKVILLPPASGG